jgi:hypothetical protein
MSVTLINGDGNPRVLASQDADWYGALTGEKTCIVPINDNLSATITDSNTVEIGSGVCITKEGRRVQIDEGDIEEIIIPTGTHGVDTYYIIGFHLYINELGQQVAETFVETMASATDTITETTFKEGSSSIYVSLYRVKRSGLLMDSVTKIIPTLKTIVDINDTLGSSDISAIGDGTVTGGLSQLNSDLTALSGALRFPELPPNNDLKYIQSAGDYGFVVFRFNAETVDNPTSVGSGVALTFRISSTIAVQLAFTYIDRNIYVRTKNSGWSSWRTI